MRTSTVRRVVAGVIVVSLVTLGAAALLSTTGGESGPTEPVWAGAALGTERGTSTEFDIAPVKVTAPERVAARLLGKPDPAFTPSTTGSEQATFIDGDVTVRLRTTTGPTTMVGQRASSTGVLPSDAEALATANTLLRAFKLDAKDWTVTQPAAPSFKAVYYRVKADLPVFTTAGVQEPTVSVAVDDRGVRSFSITLADMTPRRVAIRSEQEAFADVTRAGRYVSVRLVLVDSGQGRITPHWEFEDDGGKKVPIPAVLTA